MNYKPLVSIIVPCYNHARFLSQALHSVINQTYGNWECIIVNDGSPDNTEEVAQNWIRKDVRFKYHNQVNGGLSNARNSGVKISKGELILPLDADDILHHDYLIKMVPELVGSKDDKLGFVSCYRRFFRETPLKTFYDYTASGSTVKDLMFENIIMPSSIYKRECWEEVGGYDEQMKKGFEDWEFWINITKRGYTYKFVKEFLFYYRKSKKSMLVDTLNNHVEANIEYVFKKHKELYIEHFDMTLHYLLFLIKRHKTSERKIKGSLQYKIAKALVKPLKLLKIIR